MMYLFFACLLMFQTASCMTKDEKLVQKSQLTHANASFYISLDSAFATKELKNVQAVFEKESKNVEIKTVLNCVDSNGMLAGAVSQGCGVDILTLLRQHGAEFCGIAGKNPTLRVALLNRLYTEQEREAVVQWLIKEDLYVPAVSRIDGFIICQDETVLNFVNSVSSDVQAAYEKNESDGNVIDRREDVILNGIASAMGKVMMWFVDKTKTEKAKA